MKHMAKNERLGMRTSMLARNAACIVSLILMSCAANAADVWHTSTIKSLYPLADGNFVLIFDTSSAACTAAGPDKYQYVMVGQNGMTAEGAKKIYAAAMMALSVDKTVDVAFDDSTTNCFVNRLAVRR